MTYVCEHIERHIAAGTVTGNLPFNFIGIIMVTKVKASRPANTATAAAVQDVTDVTPNQEFSFLQAFLDGMENQGNIDFQIPTGRRQLVALVATLATIACGVYVGIQVGVYVGVGALMLTGSAFIAFVLSFMASAITALASLVLAGKVQKFILLGGIDDTFKTIKTKSTQLLARFNREVTA